MGTRLTRAHIATANQSDSACTRQSRRPVGYASERWARLVATVLISATDIKTVDAWAREAAISVSALKTWCRAAGLRAKTSLDFARLLRAVRRHAGSPAYPYEVLDVVDERTMSRLLRDGGICVVEGNKWPTVAEFLNRQTLIRDPSILQAIADALENIVALPATLLLTTAGNSSSPSH